jgi:hypothetical protein
MNADNATIDRLLNLSISLEIAAQAIRRLHLSAITGDVGPAEAAAEVNETIATLVKAAE